MCRHLVEHDYFVSLCAIPRADIWWNTTTLCHCVPFHVQTSTTTLCAVIMCHSMCRHLAEHLLCAVMAALGQKSLDLLHTHFLLKQQMELTTNELTGH